MRHFPRLVPRPHYSARPKRFGSRGASEDVSIYRPFTSDTSPKQIDREGLRKPVQRLGKIARQTFS